MGKDNYHGDETMRTCTWKIEKEGEGRFFVRLTPVGGDKQGHRVRGFIIGARRRWLAFLSGEHGQYFPTRRGAAAYLVQHTIIEETT